jgi:hypothetical protein
MTDTHNSEGQHRSYQRDLKGLHNATGGQQRSGAEGTIFNPILGSSDEKQEREGARLLSNELKRRSEKVAKKRKEKMDFEETDVTYINKRNKHFNEKISRNYDKHNAEIRQNLERGTAL